MKTDYLDLIRTALADGLTLSVWDGEEWQVRNSTSYKAIKDAVESVDDCNIRLRCPNASRWPQEKGTPCLATVAIVHNGNEYENVCDWSYPANTPDGAGWMDSWHNSWSDYMDEYMNGVFA